MGRIKTDMVKRATSKMVKTHPEKFTKNFTKNKIVVGELAEIRSKKLRNIIAGYSVRLKRQSENAPKPRKRVEMKQYGGFKPRRFQSGGQSRD